MYISTALWGNRMDLSLWPAGKKGAASRYNITPNYHARTALPREVDSTGPVFDMHDGPQPVGEKGAASRYSITPVCRHTRLACPLR